MYTPTDYRIERKALVEQMNNYHERGDFHARDEVAEQIDKLDEEPIRR